MSINVRQIAALSIVTLMIFILMGCANLPVGAQVTSTPIPGLIATPAILPGLAISPGGPGSPNPGGDAAAAQATITSGQNQLLDLARQATEVSLSMTQAANAAVQSTQQYDQLQKINLNY